MNTIVTASLIAKETMRAFVNALGLGQGINMQYKDEFANGGFVGKSTTVNIKKPVRFTVSTGQALDLQDVLEETTPFTIQYQDHVDFQFSSQDLAVGIVKFRENYLIPAASALAAKFDTRIAQLYQKAFNFVGVPGTIPTTALTYLNAKTALNLAGCPDENARRLVINSAMHANIVETLKTLTLPTTSISEQFRRGVMGQGLGFTWQTDDNIIAHTCGTTGSGGALVNGASQTGAAIITDTWTSATPVLKKGDIVQFAGVYSVNPLTFLSTGVLANFTLTADITTADTTLTLPISPPIVTSGPTQNVSASPADNAVITFFGGAAINTYTAKVSSQGLAFHPKALTAAFIDLPLPRGADMAARISDPDLGISMRVWRDGDIQTDQFPCRVDIFYGVDMVRPEWVCRVCSA